MAVDATPPPFASLIDAGRGVVNRSIFSDPEIYQTELRNIFARCWLFLGHVSQIPNPGDFINVLMGEEPVLVCRDPEGNIAAFLNSCRHRGNKVCRADTGNATTFHCPYHGWTYDLRGALVGVPGHSDLYHEAIDFRQWGLARLPLVEEYRGMIFGTFDAEAPPLVEYLGDIRYGLDLLFDQGDFVAVPGVARWTMNVNWKFASDNSIGDMYHGFWTHRSALLSGHIAGNGMGRRPNTLQPSLTNGFTMVSSYGHGFTADFAPPEILDPESPLMKWRFDPDVQRRLGPLRMKVNRSNLLVFPNLFVNSGSREFMLRNPLGPGRMEVWKTTLVDKNLPPEVQRAQVRASNRHFGPAGMFEQDDGENWDQSTAAARGVVAQRYGLNYSMGLGHGVIVEDGQSPPRIDTLTNEHGQLWMYRCWAEYMDARSWPELRATHASPSDTL